MSITSRAETVKPGDSKVLGLPAYGIRSGGFDYPADTECEYLGPFHEHHGGAINTAFTGDWFSYFAWPSGSGGKITIRRQGVFRVHFRTALYMSSGAWVVCKLRILRGNDVFEVAEASCRIDQATGTGTVDLMHEADIRENDQICITMKSDKDIHGAPNGQFSQLHIQLIGFPP